MVIEEDDMVYYMCIPPYGVNMVYVLIFYHGKVVLYGTKYGPIRTSPLMYN